MEADEIVERAACQIRLHQRCVDVARLFHGLEDRLLGDRVEDDALNGLVLERLLLVQHLENVPGNGLSLAVGVSREDQAVGTLDRAHDVVQPLLRLGVHVPDHREIMIRVDGAVLGGEVADMTVRRKDLIVRPKVLVDGLGLGRRFHNDDIHETPNETGRPDAVRAAIHVGSGMYDGCRTILHKPCACQMTFQPERVKCATSH